MPEEGWLQWGGAAVDGRGGGPPAGRGGERGGLRAGAPTTWHRGKKGTSAASRRSRSGPPTTGTPAQRLPGRLGALGPRASLG